MVAPTPHFGYIYALLDPMNLEVRYIGKTIKQLEIRLTSHLTPSALRKPSKLSRLLIDWLRVGRPIIAVVDVANDQEELDRLEVHYIADFNSRGYRLVNRMKGGGSRSGYVTPEETKRKISISNTGIKKPPHTVEWKTHMSSIMTGRKQSKEEIEAKRVRQTGRRLSLETKCKISVAKRGVPMPRKCKKPQRDKISISEMMTRVIATEGGRIYGRIYGLYDPRNMTELRYIGQTITSLSKRLQSHISPSAMKRNKWHSGYWVESLLNEGVIPVIKELQVAYSLDDLNALEVQYIAKYRSEGAKLTNIEDGGDGFPRRKGESNPKYRKDINTKDILTMVRGGSTKNAIARYFRTSASLIDYRLNQARISGEIFPKFKRNERGSKGRKDVTVGVIVDLISAGKTQQEVCDMLQISKRIIRYRLNRAKADGIMVPKIRRLPKVPMERRSRGEAHYSMKLTDSQLSEIREKYATGQYTQKSLAAEYGVGQPHISSVVLGKLRK